MPVKLHVILSDLLVVALLVVLEEVAHVLPDLDDLLVQVLLGNPSHKPVNAVVAVQVHNVDLLRVAPCPAAKAIVENQCLFVGLDPRHPLPCCYLPKVTSGLGAISILFRRELWGRDLVGSTATPIDWIS